MNIRDTLSQVTRDDLERLPGQIGLTVELSETGGGVWFTVGDPADGNLSFITAGRLQDIVDALNARWDARHAAS